MKLCIVAFIFVGLTLGLAEVTTPVTKSAARLLIEEFQASNPKYANSPCMMIIDDWIIDASPLMETHSFIGFSVVERFCNSDASLWFSLAHTSKIYTSRKFQRLWVTRISNVATSDRFADKIKFDQKENPHWRLQADDHLAAPCANLNVMFEDLTKSPFSKDEVGKAKKQLKTFVLNDSRFSCVMGKIAFMRDSVGFGLYSPNEIPRFLADFHAFTKLQIKMRHKMSRFAPFVAQFPSLKDQIKDDSLDWEPFVRRFLQAAVEESNKYFPLGMYTELPVLLGMTMSVVSGHPNAARNTRRFPLPTIVFTPLAQFWLMEYINICTPVLKLIHDLEKKNDGSVNPIMHNGDFPHEFEACQARSTFGSNKFHRTCVFSGALNLNPETCRIDFPSQRHLQKDTPEFREWKRKRDMCKKPYDWINIRD